MATGSQIEKPVVHGVVGANAFEVVAKVSKALERLSRRDDAKEMRDRAFASDSYEALLEIVREYAQID